MKNINPKYFNAFLAVVESNSFSHAATKAYMTQANVSKHIQALEDQIGHKLQKPGKAYRNILLALMN